jgi:hypothetical protein
MSTVRSITEKRASEGKRISHQAQRKSWACCRSSPQLGVKGGRPKPRKSSAASEPIAPMRLKGKRVISGVRALGRMWPKMMRAAERPWQRAASTKVRERRRRNSARMK